MNINLWIIFKYQYEYEYEYNCITEYESDTHSIGAVIGRVAGHISNGKFALDSKEYELGLNAPPHHMNGGIRGSLSKVNIKF